MKTNEKLTYEDINPLPHYTPRLRSAFNYDTDQVSLDTGLSTPEPTLTQQNTAEQTDINYIVQQFTETGYLPQIANMPSYGDFSGVNDYQEALHLLREAENGFNALPAQARAYFENDPGSFLNFMQDPDPQILADLGLATIVNITPQPSQTTPQNDEKSDQ